MINRRFTLADQIEFASFSHDFNPIHVDPIASRRLIYGQPVVHGVNAMLWALATFASDHSGPVKVQDLTCSFTKPLLLHEEISVDIDSSAGCDTTIRLRQGGQVAVKISLAHIPCEAGQLEEFQGIKTCGSPFGTQPDLVAEEALAELVGEFSIAFNIDKAVDLYGPRLITVFGGQAIAEMTALTKVVGMHAPGLNSLFTEIKLKPATAVRQACHIHYKTQEYDKRFHQLVIACNSRTFDSMLKTFYRPPATSQPGYSAIKKSVSDAEFELQRALVIGGSRGLGEVTAKYLAAGGAQVLLTYSRGVADADAIVQDISLHGGIVQSALFDLTTPDEEVPAIMNDFAPTDIYYFATPFIFSGQKGVFAESRLKQFMDFYVLGFHRIVNHFSKRGANRYFCPSSVALAERPAAMGEYCVAKAAMEAYCEWVVKNKPHIKIAHPRLPRLATDQTASIAVADNGDTALMLELLRDFHRL
jgi:NADP-dependent 3-hydroxy acid dehydrogenase YdfG